MGRSSEGRSGQFAVAGHAALGEEDVVVTDDDVAAAATAERSGELVGSIEVKIIGGLIKDG